ncbi:hypothetical protein ANTPLA_LOCUS8015 [Anthophora plagiata]
MIELLSKSDEANLRRLLSGLELGNRKPSELLRKMTQFAGANVGENALRTLWMQRLPSRVQEVLTIIDDASLERLTKVADKTMERSGVEMAAIFERTHAKNDEMAESSRNDGPTCQDDELAAIMTRLSRIEEAMLLDGPGQTPARKKLRTTSQIEAIEDDPQKHRLIIRDAKSKTEFLIDTGADVSLMPRAFGGKGLKVGVFKLHAANGAVINTYGEKLVSLNLGLRRDFP